MQESVQNWNIKNTENKIKKLNGQNEEYKEYGIDAVVRIENKRCYKLNWIENADLVAEKNTDFYNKSTLKVSV